MFEKFSPAFFITFHNIPASPISFRSQHSKSPHPNLSPQNKNTESISRQAPYFRLLLFKTDFQIYLL